MQALATPSTKTVHLLENGLHPPLRSSQTCGWQNIVVDEFPLKLWRWLLSRACRLNAAKCYFQIALATT